MKGSSLAFSLCLIGGVFAWPLTPVALAEPEPTPAPLSVKDAATGMVFYVETDQQHLVAIDREEKVKWILDIVAEVKQRHPNPSPSEARIVPRIHLIEIHDGQVGVITSRGTATPPPMSRRGG
jgi:hypothetical protein